MSVCAYSALILSSSATVTSLILTTIIGALPIRAAKDSTVPEKHETYDPEHVHPLYLLRRFGVGGLWEWLLWHCESSLVHGHARFLFLITSERVRFPYSRNLLSDGGSFALCSSR